jgi:hypothetical protein
LAVWLGRADAKSRLVPCLRSLDVPRQGKAWKWSEYRLERVGGTDARRPFQPAETYRSIESVIVRHTMTISLHFPVYTAIMGL